MRRVTEDVIDDARLSSPKQSEPPPAAPAGPRTKGASSVRMGPGNDFAVVGVMPPGALVQIVGRDPSAQWVAIVFPPNSSYQGWLPVTAIGGARDSTVLESAPVSPGP